MCVSNNESSLVSFFVLESEQSAQGQSDRTVTRTIIILLFLIGEASAAGHGVRSEGIVTIDISTTCFGVILLRPIALSSHVAF